MSKIIAIVNQKGGVGKTTVTVNLAVALAGQEKSVLMVDLDPQASLTDYWMKAKDLEHTVYHAMLKKISVPPIGISEGLDLLPANSDLAAAEKELNTELSRERKLSILLRKSYVKYDYILIDCSPSLSNLTVNALTAADYALIPVITEGMAIKAIPLILNTIEDIQELGLNPGLKVWKILPTIYNNRFNHHQDALAQLTAAYPNELYASPVKSSVKYKDASMQRSDVAVRDKIMGEYWDEMAVKLITDTEGQP